MDKLLIERKRYFNIFKGNIIVEYEELIKAIAHYNNSFIVVDEFKSYIDKSNYHNLTVNKWKLSKYSFFNCLGDKIEYTNNNWKLLSLETIYKTGKYIEYIIGITDPNKELRLLEHTKYRKNHFEKASNFYSYNDHDLQIVVPSFRRFYNISKFINWKDFETRSPMFIQYK